MKQQSNTGLAPFLAPHADSIMDASGMILGWLQDTRHYPIGER